MSFLTTRGKIDGSVANFVRIPDQTGHRFRFKLDTHSGLNWTPIPVQTGQ
jgi:hypothetical protein